MADVCKNWIDNIKNFELDKVVKDLQLSRDTKLANGRHLFKVLKYLSICADQCLKRNLCLEAQVFKIAHRICEFLTEDDSKIGPKELSKGFLTEAEDKKNLFSALFYIIQYVLKKPLFHEASVLTRYLLPDKILRGKDRFSYIEYYQIANLWSREIAESWDRSLSSILSNNPNEDISNYIKFHLEMLGYCDKSTDYTLRAADTYIKKISSVAIDDTSLCLKIIFTHLSQLFKNMGKSVTPEVYSSIISMMSAAFFRRKDAMNNPKICDLFQHCNSIFPSVFTISSQYYNSYKMFREYTCNLLETNFMTIGIGEKSFSNILRTFDALLQEYGVTNFALIKTVVAVTNSFEILFTNLESVAIDQPLNNKITQDDLTRIGGFVSSVYDVVINNEFPKGYVCRKCPEPTRCSTKNDVYNAGLIISSFLKIVAKFPSDSLTEKLFKCAKKLMEKLVSSFHKLRISGCKYSEPMWDMCGRTIFNVGLISESRYPAELEKLYEELCKQVIIQDGLHSKISTFGLENPVSTALHRLCNSLVNQGKYREAMTHTAYNALISTNESRKRKAYDLWANIKSKCPESREIQELTLLQCLKDGNSMINKKFDIDIILEKYDLGDLCLREIKFLYSLKTNQNCLIRRILKNLESLNDGLNYSRGILLLCFHTLQFQYCKRELVSNEILKASETLKKWETKTLGAECLQANLNFFKIIEKLYIRNQAIREQIDDAKFTIRAFKVFKSKSIENESEIEDEIIPTYGGIDFEKDNALAKDFREVLASWDKCLQNERSMIDDWEPKFTLETIIICGEYCRLFNFSNLEEKCWKLSHKLSLALQDYPTCVYVTSRSISLRCINDAWIADAKIQAENLKNSTKAIETDSSILFWLSLADFYLDCNKVDDAKVLLQKVKSFPSLKMLENPKLYIYATDIQFRNYHLLNDIMSQEEYIHLMVEIHYLMINLDETVTQDTCRFWNLRFHLFTCEQLLECMCNIVIPMNGLLSYRETSSHLFYGLRLAQSFGLTLRIAEFLKYLCYIDLLRLKTDDCETKLQDIEHILRLESFQASMQAQPPKEALKPMHVGVNGEAPSEVRTDASSLIKAKHQPQDQQRCASPELKRKLFAPPKFLSHKSCCECFECANLSYQQLCLSSAHLRAHMYSLLSYVPEAEQHFHGAARIAARLDERDSDSWRRHPKLGLCWRRSQRRLADEMQFKIDLACHLFDHKPDYEEDAALLVEQVIEINQQNRLGKTSALHQAVELYAQRCIYNRFADRSSIMVPSDIDITITNGPVEGCITPKQQIEKPTRNPRRRKSPVPLAIPVITISDTSDDEVSTIGNSPIPSKAGTSSGFFETEKAPMLAPTAAKPLPKRRNVRRKILADETEESAQESLPQAQPAAVRKSTRLSKKPAS